MTITPSAENITTENFRWQEKNKAVSLFTQTLKSLQDTGLPGLERVVESENQDAVLEAAKQMADVVDQRLHGIQATSKKRCWD